MRAVPKGGRPRRCRSDRGTGLIGSLAGLVAALMFVAFAAQLLLGLYATTTLRATLHDAASRGADLGTAVTAEALADLAAQAEASLGQMGERTSVVLRAEDSTGDGLPDVVVGEAVTVPPRVVPRSVGGMIGFEEVRVGVRVRIERIR